MPQIVQIFVSPGHNFFGHHGQAPGENPVVEVNEVECVAGKGLQGDRFFDYQEDYGGQVTFFSKEVFDSLCQRFQVWDKPVSVLRRNVIVEGVDLNDWIGKSFEIQDVKFEGAEEAKPCYWMDSAFVAGTEEALRGQGGLRARIVSDGVIRPGIFSADRETVETA
jgi:MOSC domain-containing protein YiiM